MSVSIGRDANMRPTLDALIDGVNTTDADLRAEVTRATAADAKHDRRLAKYPEVPSGLVNDNLLLDTRELTSYKSDDGSMRDGTYVAHINNGWTSNNKWLLTEQLSAGTYTISMELSDFNSQNSGVILTFQSGDLRIGLPYIRSGGHFVHQVALTTNGIWKLFVEVPPDADISSVTFSRPKLEAGSIATAWCPNVADLATADALSAEATRATGAESVIRNALDAEVTRAKAAESANATNVAKETSRATQAEADVRAQVLAESNRAKAEEAKHQAKLTFDSKPTKESTNPVTSDGIAAAIAAAQTAGLTVKTFGYNTTGDSKIFDNTGMSATNGTDYIIGFWIPELKLGAVLGCIVDSDAYAIYGSGATHVVLPSYLGDVKNVGTQRPACAFLQTNDAGKQLGWTYGYLVRNGANLEIQMRTNTGTKYEIMQGAIILRG